jgi:hypothetical protein
MFTSKFTPLSRHHSRTVKAGLQELAVLRVTGATEDTEVVGKQEAGRIMSRIANIVDENVEQ